MKALSPSVRSCVALANRGRGGGGGGKKCMRPTVGRIGKGKREREGFPSASRRRRALLLVCVCVYPTTALHAQVVR